MRIDTQARQRIQRGDISTIRELVGKEITELTKTLKTSVDILTIRHLQGQLMILEKLASALT